MGRVRTGTPDAGATKGRTSNEGSCTWLAGGAGRRGGHDPARRRTGRSRSRRGRGRGHHGKRFSALVFSKTAAFRHTRSSRRARSRSRQMRRASSFDVDATEDAAAFTDANLARYDVVIFLCTTGDVLDDAQQAAFERYISAGGGYAGIHAASDTEYDWAWYGGLVGAYFRDHPGIGQPAVPDRDRERPGPPHRRHEAPAAALGARGGVVQLPHQPAGHTCTSSRRSTSRPTTRAATACPAAHRRWATTRSPGASLRRRPRLLHRDGTQGRVLEGAAAALARARRDRDGGRRGAVPLRLGAPGGPSSGRARRRSGLLAGDRTLELLLVHRRAAVDPDLLRLVVELVARAALLPVRARPPAAAARRRHVLGRGPRAGLRLAARAFSLLTVRAAISSARDSDAPCSFWLSLMCSYWRARLCPTHSARGHGCSFRALERDYPTPWDRRRRASPAARCRRAPSGVTPDAGRGRAATAARCEVRETRWVRASVRWWPGWRSVR